MHMMFLFCGNKIKEIHMETVTTRKYDFLKNR